MGDTKKAEDMLSIVLSKTCGKVQYIASYETHGGKQFALERKTRRSEGLPYYVWMQHLPPHIDGVEIRNLKNPGSPYGKNQPRTAGLSGATSPSLMTGKVAFYIKVRDIDILRELAERYEKNIDYRENLKSI